MCILYGLAQFCKSKDETSEEPNTRPAKSSYNRGESPNSRMPGGRVSRSARNGWSGGGHEGRPASLVEFSNVIQRAENILLDLWIE
ncbi:uncharacterized protein RSE6_12322 [Rhynchosporium secalis]|uniref:Uncharacterized protein n=1 Tax=Rhynchosporium secalis TaxID=38038 RepID=A0A1E1MR19_RHYSE|nr:uncharacterized protein RSE6_12322 [Rhynchosporium secalis]